MEELMEIAEVRHAQHPLRVAAHAPHSARIPSRVPAHTSPCATPALAQRHEIALPQEMIEAYLKAQQPLSSRLPRAKDTAPEQPSPPAVASSPALSRARAWRYQYMEQQGSPSSNGAAGADPRASPSPPPPAQQNVEAGTASPGRDASATGDASPQSGSPREVGVYEGERNAEGQREGRGACWYDNGIVYVGDWRANVPDGRGKIVYPSGDVFEGDFRAGTRDGSGTFAFPDGRVEVARYVQGANSRGEGAMWSADRRMAWRIVRDGEEVEEISLEEADQVAARVGEPVPGRFWRDERLQVPSPPMPISPEAA
jgi:hypothetical protein